MTLAQQCCVLCNHMLRHRSGMLPEPSKKLFYAPIFFVLTDDVEIERTFELLSIQNLFNGFHCINQYADIVCDEMWKQSRQRNISQKLNTISREYNRNRVWLKKKKSNSRLLCTLHNTLRYFSNFTKHIYQTHINFRLLFHTSAKKIHVKTSTRWNHGVNILL